MTIQSALNFIHHVMNNDDGRRSIREFSIDTDIDQVVKLGRDLSFEFTRTELRQAFKIDWQMRLIYFSSLTD